MFPEWEAESLPMYTDWWRERAPTAGWWARDHCQAQRTGANVKISQSVQKKNLSLLYSTVLYLCIPSIFWGDNSPCVCCPDSFLPLSKGHVLLAIFSSFIHARTLTFLYDFMLFGCHFWCTCETSSKVIRTNCKYLLENSPYQFHGPLVCPALTAHQYLPSWSLWVIPSLRWLSATSLLSRMSFELFV